MNIKTRPAGSEPLVSIVIPCFNSEAFIAEAIESCLRQTYRNREIVVVDDGSSDGTSEIAQQFDIRYIRTENRGACAARNRGIDLANGDYLQFLDADDRLHPLKLAQQMPVVQKDPHVLIFCDARYLNSTKHHPHHCRVDDTSDPVQFMLRAGLQTALPIHRRSWLEKLGGWNEELPCAQERDLHLRIAASGVAFQRLARELVEIRHVDGSVSSSYIRVMDQHEKILHDTLHILQENGGDTPVRRQAMAGLLARDAREFSKRGEWARAKRYFRLAKSYDSGGGLADAFPNNTWLPRLLGGYTTSVICNVMHWFA